MAQTTYQVILSTDGKHTVIVTTDNSEATSSAIAWASTAYAKLVERDGSKHQQRQCRAEPGAVQYGPWQRDRQGQPEVTIRSPKDVAELLMPEMQELPHEEFHASIM